MMRAGKPVNVGDHIEYVICEKEGAKAAAERAFHPDDVERSEGELKVRGGVLRLHMCEFSLRFEPIGPPLRPIDGPANPTNQPQPNNLTQPQQKPKTNRWTWSGTSRSRSSRPSRASASPSRAPASPSSPSAWGSTRGPFYVRVWVAPCLCLVKRV